MKNERRDLTELESNTLGLIGAKGPCTAYAVRREFLQSPSPFWSGSAGAIYPLITRLEQRKLIRLARRTADGRRGKLYSLTASGRRALQRWIGMLLSPDTAGVPPDPLRNRIEFFHLLDKNHQKALLEQAELHVGEQLSGLLAYAEERRGRDLGAYLTCLGACRMMQARLDWLREVAEILGFRRPTPEKGA